MKDKCYAYPGPVASNHKAVGKPCICGKTLYKRAICRSQPGAERRARCYRLLRSRRLPPPVSPLSTVLNAPFFGRALPGKRSR